MNLLYYYKDIIILGSFMKYTTIPISKETKELLDKLRGKKSWDKFLRELVEENMRLKRVIAAQKLEKMFTEEELELLEKICKEERSKWKFRSPEELF